MVGFFRNHHQDHTVGFADQPILLCGTNRTNKGNRSCTTRNLDQIPGQRFLRSPRVMTIAIPPGCQANVEAPSLCPSTLSPKTQTATLHLVPKLSVAFPAHESKHVYRLIISHCNAITLLSLVWTKCVAMFGASK
jgi:hypothetical protein